MICLCTFPNCLSSSASSPLPSCSQSTPDKMQQCSRSRILKEFHLQGLRKTPESALGPLWNLEGRNMSDQGRKSPGLNISMPDTRAREVGEVRREQDTGSSHQMFLPFPKEPGWKTWRILLSIQVTSLLARTERGPLRKAGKRWAGGGGGFVTMTERGPQNWMLGGAGMVLSPVTDLTMSSLLS